MSRIGAILLAAGESRRMGDRNKLSLPVDGESLLVRSARVLLASRVASVTVVLGHQARELRRLLGGLPARVTVNRHYRDGQMTSVHQGLRALQDPCDGVLIGLADQPLLQPEDVNALLDAFTQGGGDGMVVPSVSGQRGNPVVVARQHREAILAGERNLGCRRLIEHRPQEVRVMPTTSRHYIVDLDTPDDVRRLEMGTL